MKTKTYVSYLRVSTDKQGRSGLGLEAQREAVCAFAQGRQIEIVAEYVEVESGKKANRPQLAAALAHAKGCGATLLIAKLDRLARNVAVVSSLMEAGVEFTACDLPEASRLMIHIMAAFAEHEREMISARTKAALAAAKARGVKLGTYSAILAARRIEEATAYAEAVEIPVRDIIAAGARSVRDVAAGLNALGIPAREGGPWGPSSTYKLLHRLRLRSWLGIA